MSFVTEHALGYQGSPVLYADASTIVSVCGNCLRFLNLASGKQRLLPGAGRGIETFTVNSKHGLLAYAEKGISPAVHICRLTDLKQLAVLSGAAELGVSALAFSADGEWLATVEQEPHLQLRVWDWKEGKKLASGKTKKPAVEVSFHPLDRSQVCTSGQGELLLWQLKKVYRGDEFTSMPLEAKGCEPHCHAWYRAGLYAGCLGGQIVAVNTTSMRAFRAADETPVLGRLVNAGSACVSSLAVNRQYVVAGGHSPAVRWFTHGGEGQQMQSVRDTELSVASVACIAFGGATHSHLAVGSGEASLHVCSSQEGSDELEVRLLGEYHAGAVTGAGGLADGHQVATCSQDGSLRLWNTTTHRCTARRTFSAAQRCLATSMATRLVALGSETGVVRLLDASATGVPVVWRSRLHSAPVTALAFNSFATLLASVSDDRRVYFTSITGASTVCVLGYVEVPETVLCMSWPKAGGVDEPVLLSLASGEVMGILPKLAQVTPGLDLRLAAHQAPAWRLSVEVPLLHMEGIAAEEPQHVSIAALATDRTLRRYRFPPAGSRGRQHNHEAKWAVHQKAGSAVAVCRTGTLLASASHDGSVIVRGIKVDGEAASAKEVTWHDLFAGGVGCLAFDACGQHLVSGGAEGAVFLHTITTAGRAHLAPVPPTPPAIGAVVDADALDDVDELTEVEARLQQHEHLVPESQQATHEATLRQMAALRQRFEECMERNTRAPELERLERSQFVVDSRLVAQLQGEGAQRIQAAQEAVLQANLRQQIIHERTKALVWDSMEVHGCAVTGLKTDLEVRNYPLAVAAPQSKLLDKLIVLRRVELAEHESMRMSERILQPLKSNVHELVLESPRAGGALGAAKPAPPRQSLSGVDEAEDFSSLLCSPFQLHGRTRKLMQAWILRKQIHQLKAKFNAEVDALRKQKAADVEKINEANRRIQDSSMELQLMGVPVSDDNLFAPRRSDAEDEVGVLTVKDEEVTIERYCSPEVQARRRAEQAAEEDRARTAGDTNVFDRALKQMMGGQLNAPPVSANDLRAVRPAWMAGNPKAFSEEQLREMREFEERDRAMVEERQRRQDALELELRNLRSTVEETCRRHDDAMAALFQTRLRTEASIAEREMRVIWLLAASEREQQLSTAAEATLTHQLESLRQKKGHQAGLVVAAQQTQAELQEQLAELQQEDKALDKAFKKEFADAGPPVAPLYQLFRKRAPKAVARSEAEPAAAELDEASSSGSNEAFPDAGHLPPDEAGPVVTPLPEADRPQDLSDGWWQRLQEVRRQKMEMEAEVRRRQSQLAALQAHADALQVEDAALAAEVSVAGEKLRKLQADKAAALWDLEIALQLKQGQVETEPRPYTSDYDHAVLLHRAKVEQLNALCVAEGSRKVDILKATKDFKKGIYGLQWEARLLERRAADLGETLKELQLLRVTREVQNALKRGDTAVTPASQEVATLENIMKHNDRLRAKNINERKAKLRRLAQQVEEKQAHNGQIQVDIQLVEQRLNDTKRMCDAARSA
ncbi:hypothetical protein WJX72_006907 [[Myrmecia] bisecta]|uniref:Cfap43 N-terminal domain-containing protein n=1 Tax=[Myrmecia] bisecta TaxID=41462 RepID=A0AAW1Q2E1_9CHLO